MTAGRPRTRRSHRAVNPFSPKHYDGPSARKSKPQRSMIGRKASITLPKRPGYWKSKTSPAVRQGEASNLSEKTYITPKHRRDCLCICLIGR